MDRVQIIIIVLLIIAILFSAISIAMNISLSDFKSIPLIKQKPAGDNSGGIKLVIEPSNNTGK